MVPEIALFDPVITFHEANQHDKSFWIRQIGVLKDRSQVTTEDDEGNTEFLAGKEVEKPIAFGFTYSEVSTMIGNIRASVDTTGMTRKQMGALHSANLVSRVKAAFPGPAHKDKRLGTHFLRSLYANVAYHFYNQQLGESLTAFISTVLAHNENSLATALSYQNVKLSFGLPDGVEPSTKKTAVENKESIAQLRAHIAALKGKRRIEEDEEELKLTITNRIKKRKREGKTFIEIEIDGQDPVTIKFNKRQKRSHDDLVAAAKETAEQLRGAKMKVNMSLLRAVGYGAATAKEALH